MSSESKMIANERLDDSLIREYLQENPDFSRETMTYWLSYSFNTVKRRRLVN